MITTQEALSQTRTIVSAVERALDQAMTQRASLLKGARASTTTRCTVNGWPIERRSYRLPRHCCATRRNAGQHGQDDGVTGHMALAYAAEVHQALLAEVGAHLTTYGIGETEVAALAAADVAGSAGGGLRSVRLWYWAGCPRHQWGQYHLVRGRNGCHDAAVGTRLHAPGSRTHGGMGAPP